MARGRRAQPELHGRADALEAIAAPVGVALASGEGGVVVLEGEAGIGKSRLIEAAADHAAAEGMAVLAGAADPLALGRPFGALIDALELRPTADDPARAELGELLFGDLSSSTGARDVQYLVQEGLVALLERLATATPVLLSVDDLQWADRATLAAVVALSRRVADLPLVVLVALRREPRSPDLDEAVGRLLDGGGTLLPVPPLGAAAVRELAAEVLDAEPGTTLRQQLDGCAGNPLFVMETLRTLEAEGALEERGGVVDLDGASLPASLRSSLSRRVDALSPEAQEALRTAAVLGSTFAVYDLAALLKRPVASTATTALEGVRAGFLDEAGSQLRFRHELIREALYEELPLAVRSALHRDAADALAGQAPTHVIAQHLALGAERGDANAVVWLRRAAAEAGPRDPATAVDLLRRAVDLQDEAAPLDLALRRELVDALAGAGHLTAAESEAKAALASPAAAAEECALRLSLARCRLLQGNSPGAIHQLRRAAETPGLDDRTRAWIAADAATARFVIYDLDRTLEEANEAFEWGERLDDDALRTAGLAIRCRVATMRAHFDEAVAAGEAAVATAGTDPEAIRRLPHLYLGVAYYEADRATEAIVTMREGIRHAEAIGAAWALPRQHNTLVAACYHAGAWDDALAEAEAGAELARETGSRAWLPQAQSIAGTIAFHRGDLDAARAAAAFAREDMDSPGGDAGGLGWLGPLEAMLLEAGGDQAGALGRLHHVFALTVELGVATRAQRLAPPIVRLALAVGDRDRAEEVTAVAEANGGPGRTASFRAAAALCRGLLDEDGDRLLEAVEGYRDVSAIDMVLAARAAVGVLEATGRSEPSRPLLEEALGWCEKIGADRHGRELAAVLRGWSGPAEPRAAYHDRPVTGWESLTPAELNVAGYVGEGLSNAEIAERLFISRRTVESHVAHVYQKLQIKGRVALAIEAAGHTAGAAG